MSLHTPLALLAALGLLCNAGAALAQVDTSEWKCSSCPFPKGATGSVEAGVTAVAGESKRFGDHTGLDRKGGYLALGGQAMLRTQAGAWADVSATDLGLDSRSLTARGGQEGKYALKLDYSELPRHLFNDDGMTPFLGVGGGTLTLPAGYPAGTTGTMPLAATLQPVSLGYKKKRLDFTGSLLAVDDWTWRVRYTRDSKEGTRPMYGSFFSTSSQLVAPLDQVTDTVEVSGAYVSRRFQAQLAYQVSRFSNRVDSLNWDNPFTPVGAGATRGQLALAPDTQLHQITGSAGFDPVSWIRVSADFAFGRLTQNQGFLAATTNAALGVPALPAASLDGRVRTFNGNVKVSATPMPDLRLNASYARDVRDDETAIRSYPLVAADVFYAGRSRETTPFDLTQDRLKASAEYRGIESVKLSAGVDQDWKRRPYHEVIRTAETTVWGRAALRPREDLGLSVKLAHAERDNTAYGTAIWFGSNENIFLRKYNLADRRRDTVGARADWTASETVSIGFTADYANDDYNESLIGLTKARSVSLGVDASTTIAERTQVTAYAQTEEIRSDQAGSSAVLYPDWWARSKDRFAIVGVGVKHTIAADKFVVGADVAVARSRAGLNVQTLAGEPAFPTAKTSTDTVKLYANYKLNDKLWINGSYWYERYTSSDWRYDGIRPSTVPDLLTLGLQSPRYKVDVVTVTLRYAF